MATPKPTAALTAAPAATRPNRPWVQVLLTMGIVVGVLGYALRPWVAAGWPLPVLSGTQLAALACSFALVPLNLGLEVAKWQRALPIPLSPPSAWRGVLVGSALGLLTPNRLGDYWGRMKHLPRHERPAALAATFLCRVSQWGPLYTLSLPLALFLGYAPLTGAAPQALWWTVGCAGLALAVLLPTLLGHILARAEGLSWLRKRVWGRTTLAAGAHLRRFAPHTQANILILSYLRHGVYLLQFALLLVAAGGVADFSTAILLAAAVFVGKSVLPSLTLAELGVREALTVGLGAVLGLAAGPLVVASLLLFTANLALPALLGAVLLQRPVRTPVA